MIVTNKQNAIHHFLFKWQGRVRKMYNSQHDGIKKQINKLEVMDADFKIMRPIKESL